MKLTCFLLGCSWDKGLPVILLGGERIRCQVCTRCQAHRYVSE